MFRWYSRGMSLQNCSVWCRSQSRSTKKSLRFCLRRKFAKLGHFFHVFSFDLFLERNERARLLVRPPHCAIRHSRSPLLPSKVEKLFNYWFPLSHIESSTFVFSLSFYLADRLKGRLSVSPVTAPASSQKLTDKSEKQQPTPPPQQQQTRALEPRVDSSTLGLRTSCIGKFSFRWKAV